MSDLMDGNKHHFYFAIAIVAISATGGFAMLEVTDTMTDLALIEGSFYGVVRNGDARLSAEISRGIVDIDFNVLDKEFEDIDEEINNL